MTKFPKCPKCGSIYVTIHEVLMVSSAYEYPNYLELPCFMPDYLHTTGECQKCKHIWKFRKSIDIDELVKLITSDSRSSDEDSLNKCYEVNQK